MNPLVERLGWTLLNAIWEVAVAWLLLRVVRLARPRASAHRRYQAGCLALLLATAAPWWTFCALDLRASLQAQAAAAVATADASSRPPAPVVAPPPAPDEPSAPATAASATELVGRLQTALRPILPWCVLAWGVGALFALARVVAQWIACARLRVAPREPWPPLLQRVFDDACRKLGVVRLVEIGLSAAVEVPVVIGWLRPVVLMPTGALVGLSPLQIQALLGHELAHVVRQDFLINLLQAVAEAVFFFHPAIHAINRQIRLDREQACDELAVQLTGDALAFAQALATLEAARAPALAAAATGRDGEGALLQRIRRLLGIDEPRRSPWRGLAWSAAAAIVVYVVGMLTVPRAAVWLLSPEQRIARIKEGVTPSTAEITRSLGPEAVMLVHGEIRRPDGMAFDGNTELRAQIDRATRRDFVAIPVQHGRFSATLPAGTVTLAGQIEGYGPVITGPFTPDLVTATVPAVTIQLSRSREPTIRFVDSDGHPVAGVEVSGTSSPLGRDATAIVTRFDVQTSDPAGEITVDQVGRNLVLHLTATKPGFQTQHRDFRDFPADVPAIWALPRAVTFHGRIVDADTQAPVANARIELAGIIEHAVVAPAGIHATSGADGAFTLTRLDANSPYTLRIAADGYSTAEAAISVTTPAVIALHRGFELSGRVVGLAAGATERVALRYAWVSAKAWNRFPEPLEQEVTGPEAALAFRHLPPGKATLTVGGLAFPVTIDGDVRDQVFDVAAAAASTPAKLPRDVIVRFRVPAGETSPSGRLGVWELRPRSSDGRPGMSGVLRQTVPVEQGVAEFSVNSPLRLELKSDRLVGYWFPPRTVDVPQGTGPFELTLDARPAVGVKGEYIESDGRPVPRARFALLIHDDAIAAALHARLLPLSELDGTARTDGHFTLTPVPFGTDVTVLATEPDGDSLTASAPLRIDAERPVPELRLIRDAGTTVRGLVEDAAGVRQRNVRIALMYNTGIGAKLSLAPVVTDANGEFTLARVNLKVPGKYELVVVDPRYANRSSTGRTRPATTVLTAHTPQPLRLQVDRLPEP